MSAALLSVTVCHIILHMVLGTMNARVFCMVIARPMFLVKISALFIVWVKVMVKCCWLINKFLFA